MIRYFYTLTYPDEPAEPIEDLQSSPKPTVSVDHSSSEQIPHDPAEPLDDPGLVASDGTEMTIDVAVLDIDENHGMDPPDLLQVQKESVVAQSGVPFDVSLNFLDQDLQVYVLAEKYGIPDLKKKAAQHFEKVLEDADLTIEVFNIIRSVYSLTMPEDRRLGDIITAKLYGEIQHWIRDTEFMKLLPDQGDFSADLLSYTIKENLKQQEATLATIDHPGYCNVCNATLVLKRWLSKRKNVNVKKYCARCDPWG